MGDMDRDAFVQLMIQELQRQKEESPESFQLGYRSSTLSPEEVFHKFDFDLPVVDDEELALLNNHLLHHLGSTVVNQRDCPPLQSCLLPKGFRLHAKLLQGVDHLCRRDDGSSSSEAQAPPRPGTCAEQVSVLVFVLHLKLLDRALALDQRALTVLFSALVRTLDASSSSSVPDVHDPVDVDVALDQLLQGQMNLADGPDSDAAKDVMSLLEAVDDQGEAWAAVRDSDDFVYEGQLSAQTPTETMTAPLYAQTQDPAMDGVPLPWGVLRDCVLRYMERLDYHALSGLSSDKWKSLHVTGTLYRLIMAFWASEGGLFTVDNDSGNTSQGDGNDDAENCPSNHPHLAENGDKTPGDFRASSAMELKGSWPRLLFLLRDHVNQNPGSMEEMMDVMSSMFRDPNGADTGLSMFDAAHPQHQYLPVLLGVLASVVTNSTFSGSSKANQRCVWLWVNEMSKGFANQFAQVAKRCTDTKNAPADDDDQQPENQAVLFSEVAAVTSLLEFLANGDPAAVHARADTLQQLERLGVIRTAVSSFVDVHSRVVAAKQDMKNTEAVSSSPMVRIEDCLGDFLFSCCCKSASVAMYVSRVPDIRARVLSEEFLSDHTALAVLWPLVLHQQVQGEDLLGVGMARLELIFNDFFATMNTSGDGESTETHERTRNVVDLLSKLGTTAVVRCLSGLSDVHTRCRAFEVSIQRSSSDDAKSGEGDDRVLRVKNLLKRVIGRLSKAAGRGGNKDD